MEQRRRVKRKASIKKRRKQQRARLILGLVLAFIILVIVAGYVSLNRYVSKYPEDKISENIYIGPINVSDMTKEEAGQAMQEHLEKCQNNKVTMTVGDQKTTVKLKSMGLDYKDVDKLIDEAFSYGKEGSLWKRYRTLKKLSKEDVVIKDIYVIDDEKTETAIKKKAVPLAEHAVDATITKTSNGFHVTKEREGHTIDMEASIADIKAYLEEKWDYSGFTVKLTSEVEQPKIKAETLEVIQDKLGSYATSAGGGVRLQNLKTGVSKVNGTVLMPGEEASVHDLTAPYDAENGYVAAGSYENGQVVDTYGGGICQVSTTLYNAILYSELEIVERFPHSMVVSYVDPSRDAAIAGDYKDLVFKNNYKDPIYIEGGIDSAGRLFFNIYGKDTRDENRKVEFESETISTEEYDRIYKEDPNAELGSKRREGSAHTGHEAQLWKIVYENGKEVDRKVINRSSYRKSDQTTYIGTKSDNPEASQILRSALDSQDPDTIEAAIERALSIASGAGEDSDSGNSGENED